MKGVGSKVRIYITNLNKKYRVGEKRLKKIICETLRYIKKEGAIGELELVFLDTAMMRAMNKKYKGIGRSTDVLSFRTEYQPIPATGTIFISIDQAKKNSRIFRTDIREEFTRYAVHGMLHLFGYVDYTERDRRKMAAKENRILKYLCTKEDLSKVLTPR